MPVTAPTTCRPSLDEVRALAAEHDLVPVVTELLADCDTPVSAFLRLGVAPGSLLLESVEGGERLGADSLLGRHPFWTIPLDRGEAAGAGRAAATVGAVAGAAGCGGRCLRAGCCQTGRWRLARFMPTRPPTSRVPTTCAPWSGARSTSWRATSSRRRWGDASRYRCAPSRSTSTGRCGRS